MKTVTNPLGSGGNGDAMVAMENGTSSSPYALNKRGNDGGLSKGALVWLTLLTLLSVVALILGAYATAKVDSHNSQLNALDAKEANQQSTFFSDDREQTAVSGYSRGPNIVEKYGMWTSEPDLAEVRSDGGSVSYKGKIYTFGGVRMISPPQGDVKAKFEILGDMLEFDPATGNHRELKPMPSGQQRYRMAWGILGAKVYIFSGFKEYDDFQEQEQPDMIIYDIASDSWEVLEGSKTAVTRVDAAGAAVNGKVYKIGGYETDNFFATSSIIDEFDPATQTWTQLPAALNVSRGDVKAQAAPNGNIYVIGGTESVKPTGVDCSADNEWFKCYKFSKANEEFDPAAGTVVKKAELHEGRGDLGLALTSDGMILAAGGERNDIVDGPNTGEPVDSNIPDSAYRLHGVDSVEEYDPLNDVWTRKAKMPFSRFRHSMAAVGDKAYVLGGSPSCPKGDIECYKTALQSVLAFHTYLTLWIKNVLLN